jgi:hypothetical protein
MLSVYGVSAENANQPLIWFAFIKSVLIPASRVARRPATIADKKELDSNKSNKAAAGDSDLCSDPNEIKIASPTWA